MTELKEGDVLFIESSYSNLEKVKVLRFTNTQIVLDKYDIRLKKPFVDGCNAIGCSGWGSVRYYTPNNDLEEKYIRQQLLLKISKINFTKLKTEKLEEVLNVCI